MFYKPNPSNKELLEFIKQLLDSNFIENVEYYNYENRIEINLKPNSFASFYDGR